MDLGSVLRIVARAGLALFIAGLSMAAIGWMIGSAGAFAKVLPFAAVAGVGLVLYVVAHFVGVFVDHDD